MPRRMIDPKIWLNLKVGSLPPVGRLLFIGIFSSADDDGRLEADPRFLKALVFPYDLDITAETIKQLREECSRAGLIRVYNNTGREYLDLPGWQEHQQIRKDRYSPSKLPPFDGIAGSLITATDGKPVGNQVSTAGIHSIVKSSLVQSSLEPPLCPPTQGETQTSSEDVKELFDLWNSLGVIKHKKLTGDMQRAITATQRDFSVAEISQAMKNYATIVNDEQCFFKYRWTIQDFLKRGLSKFLDLEVSLSNYRRGSAAENSALQQVKGGRDGRGYKPTKPEGAGKVGRVIDAESGHAS